MWSPDAAAQTAMAMADMRPLQDFPPAELARIRGVLTDIDDTLTTDGHLTAEAYAAMERLHKSGLVVVPITGRPAGWCDHIARMWPINAVVGENGAFYFRYDSAERRMHRVYMQSADERAANRARLAELETQILQAVPGSAVAADQAYRESDLAIDFREDVAPLPPDQVQRIVAIAEAAGAVAKVSSIHVNMWFGSFDKLAMTRRLFAEVLGEDLEAHRDRYVFIGDSPNDAPMFAFFPNAVGVANVRDFAEELATLPAYVTQGRGGGGFAELAGALIAARG